MSKADWPSMCSSIHCTLGSSALTSHLWRGDSVRGQEWQCKADSFSVPGQPEGRTQLMEEAEES